MISEVVRRRLILLGAYNRQIACDPGFEPPMSYYPRQPSGHTDIRRLTAEDEAIVNEYVDAGELEWTDPAPAGTLWLVPVDHDRVRELLDQL
jgi:hypothetical protein